MLPFQSPQTISYCTIQRPSLFSSLCTFSSSFHHLSHLHMPPLDVCDMMLFFISSFSFYSLSFPFGLLFLHLPFQCNTLGFLCSHVFSLNDLRHFPSPRLPSDCLKSMGISYVPGHSVHIYNSLLGMDVLCVFQIQHVQNDTGL